MSDWTEWLTLSLSLLTLCVKCVGDNHGYIVKEIHKQSAQGAPWFLAAFRKVQKDSNKNLFLPVKENVVWWIWKFSASRQQSYWNEDIASKVSHTIKTEGLTAKSLLRPQKYVKIRCVPSGSLKTFSQVLSTILLIYPWPRVGLMSCLSLSHLRRRPKDRRSHLALWCDFCPEEWTPLWIPPREIHRVPEKIVSADTLPA